MNHRTLFPLVALAALVGCKVDEPVTPIPDEAALLRRMVTCDDVRDRLAQSVVDSALGYGYYRDLDSAPSEDAADGGSSGGDAPTDFTGTNNQEAGVDEIDLVKTNGTHLFIAQDRSLQIVSSWPVEDSELLATVPLDGWARGLFLVSDERLVVVEDVSGYVDTGWGWQPALRAVIVDVSDPTQPAIEHTVDLQGWLSDARMVDGKILLVANQYLDLSQELWEQIWQVSSQLTWPENYDETTWEAARAANRAQLLPQVRSLLSNVDMQDVLPGWRSDGGAFAPLYDCGDLYAPNEVTPLAMLSVARLDPATGELTASGLMSDGWTVYASTAALYVAQTSAWWSSWSGGDGVSHIHRFDISGGTPEYTGSGEVSGWLYDQFAMSEFGGHLRVVTTDFGWWGWASGGDVAVDEPVEGGSDEPVEGGGDDETTSPPDEPAEPEDEPAEPTEPTGPANHVYVLEIAPETMPVVGHVGGIAPGETVQSVRMMGEKGYVVTFRQTDPLFTLDLSDPTAPALVGELHMPGYSAYLHPMGDDYLIGVGMAGLETGQLTGLAVNLFDVSDMADPRLIDQYEIDPGENAWSWSEAMWDHHAFTFHRDVLTMPAFTQSWDEQTGQYSGFSGTISVRVTADGIDPVGRVDHRDLVDDSVCVYDLWWGVGVEGDVSEGGDEGGSSEGSDGGAPPDDGSDPDVGEPDQGEPVPDEEVEVDPYWSYCDPDYGFWYAQVRRSVYIEDNLFTISDYGVKINDLNDPETELARVLFYPAE
jgi:uncharacterized secreted protein with C-terminal beta-propeller domain